MSDQDPDNQIVEIELEELERQPVGEGFQRSDYAMLAVLGLVVPALLLIWGWL